MPDEPELEDTDFMRAYREAVAVIPEVGNGKRWYDAADAALSAIFFGKVTRRIWHPKARYWANNLTNRIYAYNAWQRALVQEPERWEQLGLPDGERIHLPRFWVAELYTPSNIENLISAIESRRWQTGVLVPHARDASEFLRRSREQDVVGSWTRLATVQDYSGTWMSPDSTRMPLPEGISRIDLQMVPLGTALTCVVAGVTLNTQAASLLDSALRSDYRPSLDRRGRHLHVVNRLEAVIRETRTRRRAIHDRARAWLKREMPGVFSLEGDLHHPVLDLIVTEDFDPMTADRATDRRNYLRALGIEDWNWSITTIQHAKNVVLASYDVETFMGRGDESSVWQMVSRLDKALGRKRDLKSHHGRVPRGVANALDHHGVGLLSRLSLYALLDVKERSASRTRDLASRVHGRRPIGSAKKLRRSILHGGLDLATVVADIERLTADPAVYEREIPDLTIVPTRRNPSGKKDAKLLSYWAKRQREAAARLGRLDELVTGSLAAVSNLTSAVEGIRSQRIGTVVGS
jgi:hypothetical protein